MMQFRSFAETDIGPRRRTNEDAYVNRPDLGIWAVADGAGGHQAGDVASAMIRDALETIPTELDAVTLLAEVRSRVQDVHESLLAEAEGRGPGTILASTAAVLLARGEHYAALWAGDSRIYLLRGGGLCCLTHDHSRVQELLDAGLLRPEDAGMHPDAHLITRAVGAGDVTLTLEKVLGGIEVGDRFLLCSDGVSKVLTDEVMAELLQAEGGDAPAARMVHAALENGAKDNVTAVVVDAMQ
nr:protein phosphatase 2C domain-containing protein [uncultured Rhodopila sp.]